MTPLKPASGVKRILFASIAVVPLAGSDTSVMVSGSPSGSVSFASTSISTGTASGVVAVSLTALGGLFSSALTVINVVSGRLSSRPSLTMSCTTKGPATSAANEANGVSAPASVAPLPAGRLTKVQLKPSASPLASLEPVPSSDTVSPMVTVWSGPATATGRTLFVVTTTVSGTLATAFAVTMSCTTKSPRRSAVKHGVAVAAPESTAALPAGRVVNVQA